MQVKQLHKKLLLKTFTQRGKKAGFVMIESVPHPDNMLEILWGPAHVRSPWQLKPP